RGRGVRNIGVSVRPVEPYLYVLPVDVEDRGVEEQRPLQHGAAHADLIVRETIGFVGRGRLERRDGGYEVDPSHPKPGGNQAVHQEVRARLEGQGSLGNESIALLPSGYDVVRCSGRPRDGLGEEPVVIVATAEGEAPPAAQMIREVRKGRGLRRFVPYREIEDVRSSLESRRGIGLIEVAVIKAGQPLQPAPAGRAETDLGHSGQITRVRRRRRGNTVIERCQVPDRYLSLVRVSRDDAEIGEPEVAIELEAVDLVDERGLFRDDGVPLQGSKLREGVEPVSVVGIVAKAEKIEAEAIIDLPQSVDPVVEHTMRIGVVAADADVVQ